MRLELKKLQKKLGITFIYITHDQEEAINMSDRIAVMNHGTFERIGSPDEIYNHPKTSYVATFVGNANILKGKAEELEGDKVRVSLAGGSVLAADGNTPAKAAPVTLAVRSENIVLDESCQGTFGRSCRKELCRRASPGCIETYGWDRSDREQVWH